MNFRDTLPTGKALNQDDQVVSNSGRYQLILQKDGNLVLYDLSGGQKALWTSGTSGQVANQCIMQTDGNLVLYDLSSGQKALWASGTSGHPNAYLRVQDDGNLAIYQPSNPLWATNTVQS